MIRTSRTQKGSAHVIIIGCLIVALVGTLGFVFWQNFIHKNQASIESKSTSDNLESTDVTYEKLIAYTDGLDVKAYDPSLDSTVSIYSPTETEKNRFCGEVGCDSRAIAVTRDNSKVAFDHTLKDGNPAVSVYDRETKKVTPITNGEQPVWSPDGKYMAVSERSGIKIVDYGSLETRILRDTSAYTEEDGTISYNPRVYSWIKDDQIVYDNFNTMNDASFMLGNAKSLDSKKVTVNGISDGDSIRNITASIDGSILLVGFDNDPGYNVGLVAIDGSSIKKVSGNNGTPWPGSGYSIGDISPNNQQIAIINNFIPANAGSGYRSSGLYEVHDTNGKTLNIVTDYRATGEGGVCWDGDNSFYALYNLSDANNNAQMGKYDIKEDKFKLVGEVVENGYGDSISCGI